MSDSVFTLHPRLQADTLDMGKFELCRLLLMNDSRFPWFILVPLKPDLTELHQLDREDLSMLALESAHLSRCMQQDFQADKMNVAALGNQVPQLHIHHIARFTHDECWPQPVWGQGRALPYPPSQLQFMQGHADAMIDRFRHVLIGVE